MTSLSDAFGESPSNRGSGDGEEVYSNPQAPRYSDNSYMDEGEKRYAYESGRQKLYAKSPPHHSNQRPIMSSQESFKEMRPGEYGKREGDSNLQKAPVSCSSCQQDMCCSNDGVFCVSCNREALQGKTSSIPSMFK